MKTDHMRRAVFSLLAMATSGWLAAPAWAQGGYPAKPVRILVGVNAGGAADFFARTFAQKVGEATGASFVIENKAGAGGTMAADAAAKAPADGYTIVAAAPTAMIVAPYLYKQLGYSPATDFVPITVLGGGPLVLVVHADLPARSVAELLSLAKSKPSELPFGSGGLGSAGHLTTEMLASMAGINLVHVPYKGEGQAINDLLGGQVKMMFTAYSLVEQHVRSGRLRVLAISSKTRLPSLPDLPTVQESTPSLASFESLGWIGLFAPAKTPPEIVNWLAAKWRDARRQPDVGARFEAMGMGVVVTPTPDDFAALMRTETARWPRVIVSAGVKPE